MNKGENIAYAIFKEVGRWSLEEWLSHWGIKEEDFNKFMEAGEKAFSEGTEIEEQMQIEQLQYDMKYEPTFNPETGAM